MVCGLDYSGSQPLTFVLISTGVARRCAKKQHIDFRYKIGINEIKLTISVNHITST